MHFSSVTFCFAHLGAFIGCSSGPYPSVKDFALSDSGLSLALGELYPLLSESLSWFESMREVLRREKMSSETNTAISKPSSSRLSVPASPRPFHALQEECSLNEDTFFRFRDRFQFPEKTRVHLPKRGENPVLLPTGRFTFIRLPSYVALGSPSIHSLWNSFIT